VQQHADLQANEAGWLPQIEAGVLVLDRSISANSSCWIRNQLSAFLLALVLFFFFFFAEMSSHLLMWNFFFRDIIKEKV
jgi:hypothetical protein